MGGGNVEVVWHPLAAGSSVAADGARIPLLPLGDPAGPPVVLVPGLTDGLHPVSRPVSRRLFDDLPVPMDRCRGLVVSYRHPLQQPCSTQGLAADLAEVIDAHVAGPVVVVAHSMGTMVAQHLAVQRPDLVAGLVMSAPLIEVDERLRTVIERWAALVRDDRWGEFAEDALACSYTGDELTRRRELTEALPPEVPDDQLRERHLRLSEACLGHDATSLLGRISAPALVLAGEEDPVAPPWHARRLADAIAGADLHVLPGLAHGFPEQAAGPFTTFVTAFFGEVAGSDPSWARPSA